MEQNRKIRYGLLMEPVTVTEYAVNVPWLSYACIAELCLHYIFQVPQQDNGYDCRVFVLPFFEEFLRRKVCFATNCYASSRRVKCKSRMCF